MIGQCVLLLKALATLIETSEGDMRKAITTLQSAARLRGAWGGGGGGKASGGGESERESITKADIVEISGVSLNRRFSNEKPWVKNGLWSSKIGPREFESIW